MEHSATGSRASSLGRSACLNANSMISSFFTIFEVLAVLLATHFNGQPLTVDHGAPLRLLVPLKAGLKNVKAITKITIPRRSRETTGLNVDIPVTTESNALHTEPQSTDPSIAEQCSFGILIVPACKRSVHRQRPHHGRPREHHHSHRRWPSRH